VVTPRTLAQFQGKVLILPDVKCLSDSEISTLVQYSTRGTQLFLTGEPGKYDETGAIRAKSFAETLTGKTFQSISAPMVRTGQWIYNPDCPGKAYLEAMKKYFNQLALNGPNLGTPLSAQLKHFTDTLSQCGYHPSLTIAASPFCATQMAQVGGKPHLFLVNFKGLKGKENPMQMAETGVKVMLGDPGISKAWFLDFLGDTKSLTLQKKGGQLTVVLPDIQKGAIVWFDK
jgi:hypothetical protein